MSAYDPCKLLRARLSAAERDRDSWKKHAEAVEGNLRIVGKDYQSRLSAAERQRDQYNHELLLERAMRQRAEAVVEAAKAYLDDKDCMVPGLLEAMERRIRQYEEGEFYTGSDDDFRGQGV